MEGLKDVYYAGPPLISVQESRANHWRSPSNLTVNAQMVLLSPSETKALCSYTSAVFISLPGCAAPLCTLVAVPSTSVREGEAVVPLWLRRLTSGCGRLRFDKLERVGEEGRDDVLELDWLADRVQYPQLRVEAAVVRALTGHEVSRASAGVASSTWHAGVRRWPRLRDVDGRRQRV